MRRFILCTLLVVALGVYNDVQAQFNNSKPEWGLSLGGAQGSNSSSDKWVMQLRGFVQAPIISPMFMWQIGLGYTNLEAPGVYSAEIVMADLRLLFSPFTMPNLNPYIYAGFGLSKTINISGSPLLAMIPFGVGAQTVLSPGVLLSFNIGHNLSLSDQLDGRTRTPTYLNDFTNGKQDGFYGFSIGLAFTIGSGNDAAEETNKKELADAEAQRVKQQADAEARSVKGLADAEAFRVKQQADANAEAFRVKQQADANAEAQRVKALADAEAQRVKQQADSEARSVKELADAEARRLAEQKSRDTLIVLVKGKTVVLDGVNFEFNKATLTKDSERILWRAYNAMVANSDVRVVITGHTDNVGSQKANQELSLKRAQAVKNWLIKKGIVSKRMRTVGRGKNEPTSSNKTDAGRAENRCIEFFVE